MPISDTEFENIMELLSVRTGMFPRESHRAGIRHLVESRIAALSEYRAFPQTFSYYNYLVATPVEAELLVNGATINETYFFREEKQFEFVRDKVFPYFAKKGIRPLNIWSAACSSGEEIYSLLLLAQYCNVSATFTASDINTVVLASCRNGVYKKNSVRSVDGAAFHSFLEPYRTNLNSFEFPESIRKKINTQKINLCRLSESAGEPLPQNQHVIFIRNVFIYFSREMRKQILKELTEKCLAPGGFLFVSMNEVASVDSSLLPPELEKKMDGSVFYFQKKESGGAR